MINTNIFDLLNEVFSYEILNLKFDTTDDITNRFQRWANENPYFGYFIDFYYMEVKVILMADGKMKSYSYQIIKNQDNHYQFALKNSTNFHGNFTKNA